MNQNYNFVRGLLSQETNARNEELAIKKGTSFKSLLLLVVFAFFAGISMQGQVAVTVTNPGNSTPNLAASYPTLALALTDLNAVTAMSGPVTLNLAAGSEVAPSSGFSIGSATLNPVLSSTNKVTLFATPGTVTLNAGVGTVLMSFSAATPVLDGIMKICGADWITIDGLTLTDGNAVTNSTAMMEFGLAIFKASETDGASNNTIKNCTINLPRENNAGGNGVFPNGSICIAMVNSIDSAATTALVITAASGSSSNNSFFSNTTNGGNFGILLAGFADVTPFTLADTNNNVGGSSLATGNTVLNFGGTLLATNAIAGIRTNLQYNVNVSYNTVNNNNGSGLNHPSTLRGIYLTAAVGASATVNNNIITLTSGAITSTLWGINNLSGATAGLGNSIAINNNTISLSYPTATTGASYAIQNEAACDVLNMNNNTIASTTNSASGSMYPLYNNGAVVTTMNINGNNLAITLTLATAVSSNIRVVYCTAAAATCALSISSNNFNSVSYSGAAGSTADFSAIYNNSAPLTSVISNNNFNNLSLKTTGAIYLIYNSYTAPAGGSKTIQNNTVVTGFNRTIVASASSKHFYGYYDFGSSPSGVMHTISGNNFSNITTNITGSGRFVGIYSNDYSSSNPGLNCYNNTISNITHGGTGFCYGLYLDGFSGSSTLPNEVYGNTISGITSASTSTSQGGIAIIGGSSLYLNVYNNTVQNNAINGAASQFIGIYNGGTSNLNKIYNNTIKNNSSTSTSAISGVLVAGGAQVDVYQNKINTFSSLGSVFGVYVSGGTLVNVYDHRTIGSNNYSIFGLTSSGTATGVEGFRAAGGTTVNFYKNNVYGLSNSSASTATSSLVNGISLTAGTTVNVYNNLVSGLTAPTASNINAITGILVGSTTAATSFNVYNNTVYLNAAGGTNFGTTGVFHTVSTTATTGTLNLRNNIIVNTSTPTGTGVVTALRRSAAASLVNFATTSNNNMYFAGTPSATKTILYDGTNAYQTYATYFAAVGATRESSSFQDTAFSAAAFFGSTTATAANYLQPASGLTTIAESGGPAISSFTTDFNDVVRNTTYYDLGAWEFAGVSPTPSIVVSTNPATNLCTAVAKTINATITTPSGTISGAILNYAFNGVAQTAITMTNTSGNIWSGTVLVASPVNALVTWSITATSNIPLSSTLVGAPYQDEPTFGVTATATASLATVCAGSPTNLSLNLVSGGIVAIGTGTTLTSASPDDVTAFNNYRSSYKMQTVYTASELYSAGLRAGNISSIAYNISSNGSSTTNASFVVKIGTSSLSTLTDFVVSSGFTTVFPSATYTHAVGWNTINFSTPFNWDGTSNIVIEVSHSGSNASANAETYFTPTTNNTVATSFNGGTTGTLSTKRLNIRFGGLASQLASSVSWSDGTTVVGTTNPLTVNPTATTSYTGTATAGGCPIVAAPVTVTTLPLPTAPTAVSTTQCGSIVPLAAVTATSGAAGTGTFNWYAAPTGGVALQSSASTTYTTAVSATTTFYVSEGGVNACESARTPVTITVLTPPTLTLSTAPSAICTGTSTTTPVTITSTLSDYTNYSWSPSTSVTGTTGAGFTFNPTATTTYVLSASNTVTTCATTANLVVTVNPLPLITSATTSSEPLCLGSSTTLTAVSIPAAPGSATVGTGTTLTSSYGYPTAFDNYYYQVWQQYLFKASELNALGLVAGNINSITFKIAAVNDANEPLADYNVRIGSTPDNILTGFTTAGLTNVFGPSTVTAAVGLNTITFTTPYNWDGFSNIVIDLRQTGAYGSANATTYYTETNYNSVLYATSSSDNSSFWTSGPTPSTSTSRPNIIFGGQLGTNLTSSVDWTWSPATALSATTGNVVTANPTVSTVYTVTAVNPITTCTTARTVSVSLLPLPSAPTATNATQCGEQLSTASVTSTTGLTTPIFVWYAAPTGGVALQTGTSTTYTTAITATTTLYVTEYNGSCESVRVPVVMTVTAPPTIAITSTVPSFCGTGGATTLTATSADTGMTYSWASLTPSATLSAAIGASVSATLSETSNFMVTGTAADLTCLPITSYVSIGVYALPSATVATDANGVCPGTSANISSGLTAGNFAVSSIPYAATESPLTSSSIMKNGVAIRPLSGGDLDDGGWSGIPIGFNFNYFGTDFSTISAGTNGLLMFGTPPGYDTGAGELGQFGFTGPPYFPNTANPANIIALMATDMHMGRNTVDGSIKYWTEGYAPNRVFVIQYKNVYAFSANPSATVQCRLYETIGVVEIHILEKTFSRSAIVGLQDATQTIGAVAPGRAGGTWTVTTPEAWRFTPPANYNTIWTATTVNGSSTLASGTNIFTQTVAPAITTTYSISYTNQTTGCANAAGSAQTIMSVLGNTAPVGVNTITSATSICTGQTVNFSLDYTGSIDGLAFQWETFDGTTWSDIALATTTTYSTIPATATQYRCRIVACNGVPGYSSTASIVLANAIATTTPATRCGIGTASLSATANTGTTINWYDAITGGNLVGTGSPFITPTINASTTYYVGAETIGGTISGGKLAPESTWTGSTITDWGIVFNALQSRTLNSVDVYSTTAGTLDLKITDSSGIELFSTGNINVSAGGTTTPTTIPLNFNLVEGTTYKILVKDYSGVSLIRGSSNLAFPYNNGTVNVTSSEWGGTTTGTYYYIYNLQTTSICSSIRVAVTATVTAPPVIVLSANPATICSEQTSAAVTVVTGRSDYDTYAWTPSLTVSGNATTGWVFNPLTTTSYTLVASQSTGLLPCSNTASISVTVIPTPSVLTISPTPGSVCIDTVLPLVSSGGTLENMPLLNENFNGTSNTWTTVNNSTGGTPSAADWTLQPDGYSYGSFFSTIFNSNDNSQFYMSNSDAQGSSSITNTELKSPVFSTNGFSVANLSFYHYLRSPETATVDYSINGGATWVNIQTYTTTQGTSTGFVNENLPLPAGALNQASVQIRFNYIDSYGYYWAIDNVSISGTQVATMVWSPRTNLYSDAAATVPYTGGNASTVYVKSSTGAATTTYTATATSALGCARTATVPVTIYQTLAPTGLQFYQFCPSAGTTVNDMSATLIGTAIKWYTVPSGGVALAPTAALTQGYYWATQTANGCESNTRFAVFAISNATAAPSSNPLQQFCNAATVASLTANGTGLNWYTTPTGGVALASTASIATGTYYVAQTTGGCESPRTAVAVIVSAVSAPTGPATQSLSSLLTIGDIVVVGTNVVWYASSTDAATGQNPIPASQLLANTTYYATQTVSGCTSTTSLAVTITTLANQDFDMTQFSYYPNPVIDLLNVSYSQDMTNVKVFNLIGQQLLNKEVNATTTQIDMSGYANGAYFIQVSTENAMKTVRVIKK